MDVIVTHRFHQDSDPWDVFRSIDTGRCVRLTSLNRMPEAFVLTPYLRTLLHGHIEIEEFATPIDQISRVDRIQLIYVGIPVPRELDGLW